MKQLGLGKNSLERKIEEETYELCKYLSELVNSGQNLIRVDDFFDLPSLNVIWSLVNTSRFNYEDQHLKQMIELIDKFTMNSFVGPLGKITFYTKLVFFRHLVVRSTLSMSFCLVVLLTTRRGRKKQDTFS